MGNPKNQDFPQRTLIFNSPAKECVGKDAHSGSWGPHSQSFVRIRRSTNGVLSSSRGYQNDQQRFHTSVSGERTFRTISELTKNVYAPPRHLVWRSASREAAPELDPVPLQHFPSEQAYQTVFTKNATVKRRFSRVLNRFLGVRVLPYWRPGFGIESYARDAGPGMAKKPLRITGLSENLGRDDDDWGTLLGTLVFKVAFVVNITGPFDC